MLRKGISILLIALTLLFTLVGILAVWDIITIKDFGGKIAYSLLIVFVSSAVMLFIFSVLYKGGDEQIPAPKPNDTEKD